MEGIRIPYDGQVITSSTESRVGPVPPQVNQRCPSQPNGGLEEAAG